MLQQMSIGRFAWQGIPEILQTRVDSQRGLLEAAACTLITDSRLHETARKGVLTNTELAYVCQCY